MDFSKLVDQIRGNVHNNEHMHHRFRSPVRNMETGKGIFYDRDNLYHKDSAEFYVLLIDLFDRAILENNYHTLSKEQEELLTRYFDQANTLTRKTTSAKDQTYVSDEDIFLQDIWDDNSDGYILDMESNPEYLELFYEMDRSIQRLDDFLGSYIGEDNDRYARYTKKQFHCKRQPLSQESKLS